jgi:hypothetical protein
MAEVLEDLRHVSEDLKHGRWTSSSLPYYESVHPSPASSCGVETKPTIGGVSTEWHELLGDDDDDDQERKPSFKAKLKTLIKSPFAKKEKPKTKKMVKIKKEEAYDLEQPEIMLSPKSDVGIVPNSMPSSPDSVVFALDNAPSPPARVNFSGAQTLPAPKKNDPVVDTDVSASLTSLVR